MNMINGVLTKNGAKIGDTEVKLTGALADHVGRDVVVGIRPEHVTLKASAKTSPLPINLDLVEPLGSEALLHARFGDQEMVFKAETKGDIAPLWKVDKVHVTTDLVKLFDAQTGRALNLKG
jgi:multiple sugar transport system ATP-binding protein